MKTKILKIAGLLSIGILLTVSCAGPLAFRKGDDALKLKNWDAAVQHYLKAVQAEPDNPRYRVSLAKALMNASGAHAEKGEKAYQEGELNVALIEFQKALDYLPENMRAKRRKLEIVKRLEREQNSGREETAIEKLKKSKIVSPVKEPMLGPALSTPLGLKFGSDTDLKLVFSSLQEVSGITILFDEDFQTKKVSINLERVTFKEALDKLLLVTGLFYKVIDEGTILIIPDTPAKRKTYEELVLRTFYISNGDATQIQGLLRTLADINVVAVNPSLNSILIRESPQKIAVAEKIIASQDKSGAELLIDVEILEVNKTRMRELGIELSNYYITQSLAPGAASLSADSALVRGNMFSTLDSSDYLFSIPSISYKLMEADTMSKVVAKPQLRIVDGETVNVKLGDQVPVPVTTFVPIAAGGVNQQAITSYQLKDVGISMDLTPRIHHNGDITLKMKFELTFIISAGTTTMPPTIGNRSVSTIIRIRDNETGLLAGLLRDTERKAWDGVPFFKDIPILKWLFGRSKNEVNQTDIILTLTPRITRMPDITEEDLRPIWVGTEKNIGIKGPPPSSPFEAKPEKAGEEGRDVRMDETQRPAVDVEKAQPQPNPKPAGLSVVFASPQVPPNTESSLQIMIAGAENVSSAAFSLKYDPALLQVKEIREGPFLGQDGTRTTFIKSVDNSTGVVQVGISREGGDQGAAGDGELFSIVFETLKEGESPVEVTSGDLRDSSRASIPVELSPGKITIK